MAFASSSESLLFVDQIGGLDSVLVDEKAIGHELIHLILVSLKVFLGFDVVWRLLFLAHFVPLLGNKLKDLSRYHRRVLFS